MIARLALALALAGTPDAPPVRTSTATWEAAATAWRASSIRWESRALRAEGRALDLEARVAELEGAAVAAVALPAPSAAPEPIVLWVIVGLVGVAGLAGGIVLGRAL